jgi:hypothetical protein
MRHKDFHIGRNFYSAEGRAWRCTDIGTRTVIAIELDPARDPSWYDGPPYPVTEIVFDEEDFEALYATAEEARAHPLQ